MIIDGKDLIVGRVASYAAKQALLGEDVQIINCADMVITGHPDRIKEEYKHRKMGMGGPRKGPFHYKHPERYVKRVVRGMIPYKQPRGRAALARVICHDLTPEGLKEKPITIKTAHIDKVPNMRFVTVGEVCQELGWQR